MSRFFRSNLLNDSSSEDSESEEEELYSEEDSDQAKEGKSEDEDASDSEAESADEKDKKKGQNRFLKDRSDSSDSDDSDDEVRGKVKSAKDKLVDDLEVITKGIYNARNVGDWAVVSTKYDELNRHINKLMVGGVPHKEYIKAVVELEDSVTEAVEKQKVTPKKMNALSAKGLNAVKQKLRKENKKYEAEIKAFREDPFEYMLSDDESEDEAPAPKKDKVRFEDDLALAAEDDDEGFETVTKGGRVAIYTPESIAKHLRGIMESRGKKNTDRGEQIKVMEKLLAVANTPYQKIRVLLTIISTRFDLGGSGTAVPLDHWKAAEKELGVLLETLKENPDHIVVENAEEWEDDERAPTVQPGTKYLKVPGSVVSYIERLDDELVRSLQSIDPHTSEYIERLQDEGALYNIIFRGQLYYETISKDAELEVPQESINRIIMRRLEHVYFKPAQVIKTFEENSWKAVGENVESTIATRSQSAEAASLVNVLCSYLYSKSEGIVRARAMLSHVYFLALHGEYYRSRDMMLMSHLQETIPNFDVQTQILFNRTLVQIGLCAFRQGLVYEAQNTLQEICGSGRQKELLAQGVIMQRYAQVSPEQERLEKQRQLPFHMHINLELLECVYLTCSMLLEIPLLAQTGSSPDVKKRIISKTYRRMLEYHERQIFTGPPENTRDHVMQASKALAAGEWKKSIEFIHSIKIWELMPNADDIKEMLSKQIQEEGLRTYLFTYAPFYDTLAIATLTDMFELDRAKIVAVVNKMVAHEEVAASLDQVSDSIIFRKGVELSRLQSLALALSEKASALMESNERTLETRTQGTANAFERQGGRGGRGGRGGQRGRGGPRAGNTQRQAGGTQFTGGALGASVR
jgi:translation initiation factor 3 subunit C